MRRTTGLVRKISKEQELEQKLSLIYNNILLGKDVGKTIGQFVSDLDDYKRTFAGMVSTTYDELDDFPFLKSFYVSIEDEFRSPGKIICEDLQYRGFALKIKNAVYQEVIFDGSKEFFLGILEGKENEPGLIKGLINNSGMGSLIGEYGIVERIENSRPPSDAEITLRGGKVESVINSFLVVFDGIVEAPTQSEILVLGKAQINGVKYDQTNDSRIFKYNSSGKLIN